MIIARGPDPLDGHLQVTCPSTTIICKLLDPLNDHLKRPDPLNHHLKEAGCSGWSLARGLFLQMIICKWLDTPDDHLQEADPPDDHLRVARSSG